MLRPCDVRFGSEADLAATNGNVRLVPKAASAAAHCTLPPCRRPSRPKVTSRLSIVAFCKGSLFRFVIGMKSRSAGSITSRDERLRERTRQRTGNLSSSSRMPLPDDCNEVWAANSASRDGCLDVYGKRTPLCAIAGCRRLLFNASAYLGCTLGIAAL